MAVIAVAAIDRFIVDSDNPFQNVRMNGRPYFASKILASHYLSLKVATASTPLAGGTHTPLQSIIDNFIIKFRICGADIRQVAAIVAQRRRNIRMLQQFRFI